MREIGVGVGVFIVKNKKFLLGKRKNAHGEGSWCTPGGHMEKGESFQAAGIREVEEETGLIVSNLNIMGVTNDIFEKEDKHYITIHLICTIDKGEPTLCEPEKCEKWEWFSTETMPDNLFLSDTNFFKYYDINNFI
ncbi:NUDIX domain-containing protein [Candidatus Dojkabacteria bacterium]|uniref:NUDIX domain-containing protein n=1 Tax=Candidatus Dojkabacteria bacterium TaxID=2099670 RepID=A0A955L783_9BACT|nr:NUDIX domain-containing protein [Candidatus Dojkabacteria bacterium]